MNTARLTRRALPALAAAVLLALGAQAVAAGKGRYGFAVDVQTSGFMGSTLESIAIARVSPGSAAAAAGLRAGEAVLSVQGRPVRGTPTRELAARLKSARVGDRLHLTVRQADAAVTERVLTARP
jgi:predicted metalloprotease with PDZ domain